MHSAASFKFEDVKPGVITRTNGGARTVIVLEVADGGLIVDEGNYSGKVHWGRVISRDELNRTASSYITRYSQGYIARSILSPTRSWEATILARALSGG